MKCDISKLFDFLGQIPSEDNAEVRSILFDYFKLYERVLKLSIPTRLLYFQCNYVLFTMLHENKALNRYVGAYPETFRKAMRQLFPNF